jgi:asparagine synthase (glutamine-hydrolysing)
MCGIFGIYNYKSKSPVIEDSIHQACKMMEYRGPDAGGIYVRGELGLGHRRLSIIDNSERSVQPMKSKDGSIVLSYNGEIYNYIEIRDELISEGYTFSTTSDTEVLLVAYKHYGIHCLEKFNGMFAFSIWDEKEKQLFLARDRVGIKPLYYTFTDHGVVFGSEIKLLLQSIRHKPTVNRSMIDSYMSVGYVPTEQTLFSNIFKLLPGHYLTIKNSNTCIKRYWGLNFNKSEDKGAKYYINKSRDLFEDAIKLQLRSDVPLGVFLSGGIDSSAVVAMMHKLGVSNIKTFSVAWDFGKQFDETMYARQVSKMFKTEHHEHFMSARNFEEFLPDYIWHMDEPVTESAALSLYHIAKVAKEHVTVVLSGEGSDEVFGGYQIYQFMQFVEYYRKLPITLRKNFFDHIIAAFGEKYAKYADLAHVPIESSYHGVSFYNSRQKNDLYSDSMRHEANKSSIQSQLQYLYQFTSNDDLQTKMQYLDVNTWLVDDLLIKADRMSMAASLELRVPFLDHRLLEFSATMPSKYRLKNMQTKYIIKKAMHGLLPNNILYRKKMGFPTPLSMLFRGDLKKYVSHIIDSDQFYSRGYFNKSAVKSLLSSHLNGNRDHHKILWQLLVLELWHRKYID